MKRIVYVDMDNVLVDFQSGINQLESETLAAYEGHLDDVPGIFSLMKPKCGAVQAIKALSEKYELYILSTAPWNNPSAWSDKLVWVKKYFGEVFYKRLILSHHKELCKGDYLNETGVRTAQLNSKGNGSNSGLRNSLTGIR